MIGWWVALTLVGAVNAQDVVGGHRAEKGRWNDAAAIYFGGSVGCTGTLIAKDVVLTAGHCIGGITGVEMGTTDYSTYDGEYIRVSREYEYPNSWNTVDIGVVVLEKKSKYEPRIIANDCVLKEGLRNGADVTIVGFGAVDIWGSQYTSYLNEANTTVNDYDCRDLWSGCNSSVSPGGEMSAGGDGIDACFGDSGGPLYLSTDRGEFVVGVTSRGYNNTWAPCEEGGIYGRPDYVFDWIEDVTGRTLPRPDCDDNEDPDEEDPDTDPPEQSSNHAPQPTAEPFVVVQGGQGRTWVETNDPDFGDTHHFQVLEGGEPGSTTIDEDGKVTYEASDEVVGFLEIVIAVTDSGTPALTETVAISVEVLARDGNGAESPEGAGCGCQASRSSLGWLWIPLLAFLGWRIRQSRHGMAG